jgi:hypothetical protein
MREGALHEPTLKALEKANKKRVQPTSTKKKIKKSS